MQYAKLHKGEMASLQSANGDLSAHMSDVSADCHSSPSKKQYQLSMIASVNYNQSRSVPSGLMECGNTKSGNLQLVPLAPEASSSQNLFHTFRDPELLSDWPLQERAFSSAHLFRLPRSATTPASILECWKPEDSSLPRISRGCRLRTEYLA